MVNPWIEVPVTSLLKEHYVFEVTPELLEETGCTNAEEFKNLIVSKEVDPFNLDGEWEVGDSEIQEIHYEWSSVC
mgnify:CR=1 FL=1